MNPIPIDHGDRVAAAPVSWGVSEVPGWGHQLDRERVFDEMVQLGLTATEFGPAGFLPHDPRAKASYLHGKGLRAVGGFVPLVLHKAGRDPLPEVEAALTDCVTTDAGVIVLAAATGLHGYDDRPVLDDGQWNTLYRNLERISARSAASGVTAVLHPHIGTVVEDAADVDRILQRTQMPLCVDTGHLLAAGADPVAITTAHPGRVGHVHLKDVDLARAADVQTGRTSFSRAVADGLFCPLGTGGVDVRRMVETLESAGYQGWYVLEQDRRLDSDATASADPIGDVGRSLSYLLDVLAATQRPAAATGRPS